MGCKCMPLAVGGKKKHRYLVLDGEITIDSVTELKVKITKAISKEALYQIDMSNVEKCDIAGIQLIYSLLLTLNIKNKEFTIMHISSQILSLMELTGVQFPDSTEQAEG